jgi:hypothetical protein
MLKALVIGGSKSVFEEARAARELFEPDAFFLINDMIPKWPERADYFCSLHPEKMLNWITARQRAGLPMGGEVWCHKKTGPRPGHNYAGVEKATEDWAGSSGLFACKVALEEGFTKIVLAGVPMESNARHVVRDRPFTAAQAFRNGWNARLKHIAPYVRSMSGWTQELLGAPTPIWLASPPAK